MTTWDISMVGNFELFVTVLLLKVWWGKRIWDFLIVNIASLTARHTSGFFAYILLVNCLLALKFISPRFPCSAVVHRESHFPCTLTLWFPGRQWWKKRKQEEREKKRGASHPLPHFPVSVVSLAVTLCDSTWLLLSLPSEGVAAPPALANLSIASPPIDFLALVPSPIETNSLCSFHLKEPALLG